MAEGRSCLDNSSRRLTRRKRKSEAEIVKIQTSDSSSSMESIVEVNTSKEQPECITTEVPPEPLAVECAVCLQVCVHPARLPCGHIFCFLCLKGIANQSRKCAMCRQEIPADYLEKPDLVTDVSEKEVETFEDGYQWFYEGRNGWWQYDERTSRELEASYKAGERTSELLIAGFLYIADFDAMIQFRRYEPARRRRIKRDLASIPKKGIAGIRSQAEQSVDLVSQQLNSLSLDDEQSVPTTSNEE